MSNVLIDRDKIDILANAISVKSGEPVTMTLDEMVEAVDGIETGGGGITPTGNIDITSAGVTDVTNYATVTVPAYDGIEDGYEREFYTENSKRKWRIRFVNDGTPGWHETYEAHPYQSFDAIATGTSVTPTENAQTIGGLNYMMQGAVTVNAIPSNYVGSGITSRSSSDLTASGATVTVPSGYYSAQSSKAVASGTAGTPTATKGSVSNHSISVTPSVTNTSGYITGSTKTGTAVTVTASELASGNKAITQNGTDIDVVGYSTVSVNVAGAEYTRTVICPQQTVSPSSAMQQMTLTSSGLIEDAKDYIVTLDGVEWLTTCETLWSSNYCIGEVEWFLGTPSNYIYPFGCICESGIIYACFSTTGSHTIKIERLDFVTGGTTLTTKNITSNGTYNASSDSADGYSSVTVNVPTGTPTIQSLTVAPSTTQQTFNASGVDGYKPVTVAAVTQTNLTAENIKNGTTVTISNGTSNIYSVTGTYSGGSSKNVQVLQSTNRTNSSSLTKVLGDLTVSKTGTYDIYWSGGRSNTSTSYTWGTRLYVDGSGYGTENTTWTNNCQSNHLSNVSLTANQKLSVYARGRTGSYYTFAPMLVIIEA